MYLKLGLLYKERILLRVEGIAAVFLDLTLLSSKFYSRKAMTQGRAAFDMEEQFDLHRTDRFWFLNNFHFQNKTIQRSYECGKCVKSVPEIEKLRAETIFLPKICRAQEKFFRIN